MLKKAAMLAAAAALALCGESAVAFAAAPGVVVPMYSDRATQTPSIVIEDGIAYCRVQITSREDVVSIDLKWRCNMNTYAGDIYMVAVFDSRTGTGVPFSTSKQIEVPSEGYMYELVAEATVTFADGTSVVLKDTDVYYY